MISLQLQLLGLMLIGLIVKKLMNITSENQKVLSGLLINLFLPANILASFISNNSGNDVWSQLGLALVVSVVIQLFSTFAGPLVFRGFPKSKKNVMTYGMIISNSSFIGIPIVEAIYGGFAVMMTSVFQIPIRITMWTAGLSLFTEGGNLKDKVMKMVKHPCIISVVIGLLILLFKIPVPAVTTNIIMSLSRCTIGLSMLIIGMILADIDFRNCLGWDVLWFSVVRLLLYPMLVLVTMKALHLDSLTTSVSVLMTAMPAGSSTAILAKQYGYDSEYAAKVVLVSTTLSIITIPVVCLFL